MNRQKKIVEIITVIAIIICIICVVAIYMLNKNMAEKDNEIIEGDSEEVVYDTDKLRDPTKFFTIQKCIQDNINQNFTAKDMNMLPGEYIMNYAVYGEILDSSSNTVEEAYYIVRIEDENNTFTIETLEKDKYSNINQINLETDLEKIEDKGNNQIEYITVKNEDMCRIYYEQFSKLELENPEQAYQLLDDEYKIERFSDFEEYKKYVDSYKDVIETGVLTKYSVDYKDDYTEYALVDNYNNYYTLKETSVMNYTIKLDNYIIKADDYEEKYQELEEENKVQANVHIFLQMINTKDYKHAYEVLNDSFKQNNFDTVEKFEQYVNNNFFSYNLNSSSSSEVSIKKEGEYYVYNTVLRNNSASVAQTKGLTVIMKLKEGTDFEMSFNI